MSEKRYKITITESAVEETIISRSWVKGGPDGNDGGEYGYTPQIKQDKEVTRTVYSQDVYWLDLVKVIAAVNGIEVVK
jgi:hypothetical protein